MFTLNGEKGTIEQVDDYRIRITLADGSSSIKPISTLMDWIEKLGVNSMDGGNIQRSNWK